MNRNALIAAVFAIAIAVPAFAQQTNQPTANQPVPGDQPLQGGGQPAPLTPPPATNLPATLSTQESPDCKAVKIFRPDIDPSKPDITIRFQDLANAHAADKIKDCDQKAAGSTVLDIKPWTTTGFQVHFVTHDGVGIVNLPIGLTDGSANQVVCRVDWTTKSITHAKYATQWSDHLPDEIKLEGMSSYNKEAADKGCHDALPPDVQARLDAKN